MENKELSIKDLDELMIQKKEEEGITAEEIYKEVVYEGYKYIEINDYMRIYYDPYEPNGRLGFEFWVLESNGYIGVADWFNCIFSGIANFEGIRHMHLGYEISESVENGYIYCPDVKELAEILLKLRELEEKYCDYWLGK